MERIKLFSLSILIFLMADHFAGDIFKDICDEKIVYDIKQNQIAEETIRIKSPYYHHDLKPNARAQIRWGPLAYTLTSNSLGFKDSDIRNVSLKPASKRVVFIGDSFCEGPGYEYQKTFPGIIADKLKLENIEVLNAGLSYYSPIIYWRKMEYLINTQGFEFNELVVFMDISDIQDSIEFDFDNNHNVIKYDIVGSNKKIDINKENHNYGIKYYLINYLTKHSLIYAFYREIRNKFVPFKGPYAIHFKRSLWTVNQECFEEYGRQGLQKSEDYMNSILKLLRKHNIKMTLAVYPWPAQIYHKDLNSIQVSFWQKWAETNKVEFINYFPYFINNEPWEKIVNEYFIPGDLHWNAKGHQLIADIFLNNWYRRESSH